MNFSGKKIHMIGIKGVGMAALAEILQSSGAEITGSDIKEEFHTDAVLRRLNIRPLFFDAANISKNTDLVVYSSAYGEDHPERKEAAKLGVSQLSYAEVLAAIFNLKKGIMVAGSHGKTTTAALLGHIMIESGFDPTVLVGGTVINWQANARIGKSEWMVIEGDEYQRKFLNFRPLYLLITNIDYDHPDTYADKVSYQDAFEAMKARTKLKYFEAVGNLPKIDSGILIGRHNFENIGLIMKLTRELGIADDLVQKAVKSFSGVRRRCEIYYRNEKLMIIDDYAHHPAEIKATLEAVKNRWPDWKLAVIFQPHTFSRTKALLSDFAKAFKDADEVYLVPTYSSARETKKDAENIDKLLAENVKKFAKFCFCGLPVLKDVVKNGKIIIITMGAGDIWQFARNIADKQARV
jgi:UDP-N-acetylmuramate--alanine ligase